MSEKRVIFKSGHLSIEGLYNDIRGDRGVVVTHPHPLYGGDMMNNVVEALCLAYNECGYTSLRFNFRGVGQSEGTYDNGSGEQEDLLAAIHYIADAGYREIDLAGYSFGSWIISRCIKRSHHMNRILMVSPPVDLFDYSSLNNSPELGLIIAGSEDNIAEWRSIEKVMPQWNSDAALKIIPGADHFYWGRSEDIRKIVTGFLRGS